MEMVINKRVWIYVERLYIHCYNTGKFKKLMKQFDISYDNPKYKAFGNVKIKYPFMSTEDVRFADFMQSVPSYKYLPLIEKVIFDANIKETVADGWNYYGEAINKWYPQVITLLKKSGIQIKNNTLYAHTDSPSSSLKEFHGEKNIWKDIEKTFGVSKRQFGKRINYVKDNFRRKIIFRDIAQAYNLWRVGYNKPSVILAGGVIEELLRIYLLHKNVKVNSNKFNDYIQLSKDHKLLKSACSSLSDSLRHFRNIVHLAEEKSNRHTISKATANGAVSALFTIVNDF